MTKLTFSPKQPVFRVCALNHHTSIWGPDINRCSVSAPADTHIPHTQTSHIISVYFLYTYNTIYIYAFHIPIYLHMHYRYLNIHKIPGYTHSQTSILLTYTHTAHMYIYSEHTHTHLCALSQSLCINTYSEHIVNILYFLCYFYTETSCVCNHIMPCEIYNLYTYAQNHANI